MSHQCTLCDSVFTLQQSLRRHYANVHNMTSLSRSYNFGVYLNKCMDGCNCSFKSLQGLREHLKIAHNYETKKDDISFDSFEDFQVWLNNINKDGNVQYVLLKTATKTLSDSEKYATLYYYCNRSGIHVPKEGRKRKLKMQGSCKLNRNCTSSIICKSGDDGKCHVTYYKTHYKHTTELQYLRIAKQDRIHIAQKLSTGLTATSILDQHRKNINNDSLSRKDLLTRKDINNVWQSYKIDIITGVINENEYTASKEISFDLKAVDSVNGNRLKQSKSKRICKLKILSSRITELLNDVDESKLLYIEKYLIDLHNYLSVDTIAVKHEPEAGNSERKLDELDNGKIIVPSNEKISKYKENISSKKRKIHELNSKIMLEELDNGKIKQTNDPSTIKREIDKLETHNYREMDELGNGKIMEPSNKNNKTESDYTLPSISTDVFNDHDYTNRTVL